MIASPLAAASFAFSTVLGQLWTTGIGGQEPTTGLMTVLTLGFFMVFLSGLVQVVFGVLRFGKLVKYISSL